MPATYEDYRNTSTLTQDTDGYKLTRTIYVRADTEAEALFHPDAPRFGYGIAIEYGSVTVAVVYCFSVQARAISEAAAKSDNFLWEITATWSPLGKGNGQANKARWEIGFRPQKYTMRNVTDPIKQIRYGPDSPEKDKYPEVKTGINVTEDGPQGVEVDEMVEVLNIEFWKQPEDVAAFLNAVRPVLDTVNQAAFTGPWGTYAIGEARITGLTVSVSVGGLAAVTIEISRSKNSQDINVYLDTQTAAVVIDKFGWDYLWVRFLKGTKDSADTDVRPRAIDAYMAEVYPSGDFTALGITEEIWT